VQSRLNRNCDKPDGGGKYASFFYSSVIFFLFVGRTHTQTVNVGASTVLRVSVVRLTDDSLKESLFGCYLCNIALCNIPFYPSQTKICEGGTKDEIRISKEALFKGVSTLFGLRTI
jgi:hypothetical protein